MKIPMTIRFYSAVCLALATLPLSATPISYNFTVTAIDGPLAAATSTGSFSY
jgi:hypothetical protein